MDELKTDYRKASAEQVFAVKKQIVRLWKAGKKTDEIRDIVGMCIDTVRQTIHAYKEGGIEAIRPRKEGRPAGSCMSLTKDQSKEIQKLIIDKDPDQIKMPFALWTRKAVKELIKNKYDIDMPIRTVGEYLKRWGFTPQKPEKLSRHQNTAAVSKWLEEEYPAVKEQAKREDALIYWMDETAVQNCSNLVRGYSPTGQTPVLKLETKKMHINMVSAINNTGKIFFKIYKEAMNTDLLKDFCDRLIRDQNGRKVLLICDNLRVHHAYVFRDWLEERTDKIEVFYLPSYSPEYNPDEYLNNDLKQNIALKPQARNVDDIHKYTEDFMTDLSDKPDHVKSYFDHDKLKSYKN